MSLQFLFPNWLWALSLVSIPIIIHLFNFRKYKTVYFTNVHLLREVKKDTQSRTRLKELLILLARILAIVFLVLAFAQPIWVDLDKQQEFSKPSDLIILIDNSFSMGAEGTSGILLEQAKRKAIDIVNAYPVSTKIMVLSSNLSAKQLNFRSREESYELISQIKISPFTHQSNKIIDLLRSKTSEEDSRHHLYIISDFQKNNYSENLRLDDNYSLFLIPLQSQKLENVIVDTAYFQSPVHNLFGVEKLIFSITNLGEDELVDYKVSLFINDSLKSVLNLDIGAGESVLDTFNFRNKTSGIKRGRISISDFPITFDNDLFFNYSIKQNLKVGVYSDSQFNLYLDAFFKDNPYYQIHYFDVNNLNLKQWNTSDVIIINATAILSTGLQEQIKQYVEQQKPLIVFVNEDDGNEALWNDLGLKFLKQDTSQIQIGSINMDSRLFRNSFSKIDTRMDLPFVRNSKSLTRYDEWLIKDKMNKVVVALQEKSNRNILVFSTPMTEANRVFYTHPIFIPLMYNFMSDAQRYPVYYNIDEINTLYLENNQDLGDRYYSIRKGEEQRIPEQYTVNSGVKIHLPQDFEAETYSVYLKENEITMFSLNYSRKESLSEFYTKADLEKNTKKNLQILDKEDISVDFIEQSISYRKDLWYYSLLLALLFLVLEVFLIRFWKT